MALTKNSCNLYVKIAVILYLKRSVLGLFEKNRRGITIPPYFDRFISINRSMIGQSLHFDVIIACMLVGKIMNKGVKLYAP